MKPLIIVVRRMVLIASLGWFADGVVPASAQTTTAARIVEIQGTVEIIRQGAVIGVATKDTNQPPLQAFDRLRTGTNSRASLFLPGAGPVPLGAQTEVEILPQSPDSGGLFFFKGILSFIHRGEPGRMKILTRGGNAGMKGTEFVMEVAEADGTERTTLSVIDGIVSFTNELGSLTLTNGEQAVAAPGQAPRRTAGFNATNLLQWCFYYPAVLDLKELPLTTEEQNILDESLAAYRSGDLLAALDNYPANRKPGSDAGRIYYAALLLSVGQVEKCEAALATLTAAEPSEKNARLANALRTLIAAVKREPRPSTINHQLSTEFLAASYYEQSRAVPEVSLQAALKLAKQSVTDSPEFGFGWERVAELEFSFGRTERALEALNKSLALATNNAQALALKGFLLAAQNKTREAIEWFDHALVVDSALGNAWLGRGLCRIRRGDLRGGREDLLIAAALEPQRAALRSYLAKAWSDSGDDKRAANELRLAKTLDPNDPTSWLYSALNNEQHNRINEAIHDLEKSQELNNNRSVYRSGLLLDQDRAVRSANLARAYAEAGMEDWSLREASRGVNADYANYSSHLFLAQSYDALRDPKQINLRYETPAVTEYYLANLLSPVRAGALSSAISQYEYSPLFERDGIGMVSETEYLSRGEWIQSVAQFGSGKQSSYSLEAFYHSDPGQRVNNDSEITQFSAMLRHQLTGRDTIFVQPIYYRAVGGDLFQRYDPADANRGLRTRETQDPSLVAGYHRDWQPGVHTLLLMGRLSADYEVHDPRQVTPLFLQVPGVITAVRPALFTQDYQSRITVYLGELQHIWETPAHLTVMGIRGQSGRFNVANKQTESLTVFEIKPIEQNEDFDFQRFSVYGYHAWKILSSLQLIGGLTYDLQTFPRNFRAAPISTGDIRSDALLPKAGVIWNPATNLIVRGAYTRSVAGVSLEQSVQIEPSQVAGFNQLFRSLAPESVVGSGAGARFETANVALERRWPTGTYLGVTAQWLHSLEQRTLGVVRLVYDPVIGDSIFTHSSTGERLDFSETSLQLDFNQLLGSGLSFGAQYRLSHAQLRTEIPEIPAEGIFNTYSEPRTNVRGLLHRVDLRLIYNHPCGAFAEVQGLWYAQDNRGYSSPLRGDNFWQLNLFSGWRFARRRAELGVGLLNATDQDYRLNPLNLYQELPRGRTILVRLTLSF